MGFSFTLLYASSLFFCHSLGFLLGSDPCRFLLGGDPCSLLFGSDPCRLLLSGDPCRFLLGSDPCRFLLGGDPFSFLFGSDPCCLLLSGDPCLFLCSDPCRLLLSRDPCSFLLSSDLLLFGCEPLGFSLPLCLSSLGSFLLESQAPCLCHSFRFGLSLTLHRLLLLSHLFLQSSGFLLLLL